MRVGRASCTKVQDTTPGSRARERREGRLSLDEHWNSAESQSNAISRSLAGETIQYAVSGERIEGHKRTNNLGVLRHRVAPSPIGALSLWSLEVPCRLEKALRPPRVNQCTARRATITTKPGHRFAFERDYNKARDRVRVEIARRSVVPFEVPASPSEREWTNERDALGDAEPRADNHLVKEVRQRNETPTLRIAVVGYLNRNYRVRGAELPPPLDRLRVFGDVGGQRFVLRTASSISTRCRGCVVEEVEISRRAVYEADGSRLDVSHCVVRLCACEIGRGQSHDLAYVRRRAIRVPRPSPPAKS